MRVASTGLELILFAVIGLALAATVSAAIRAARGQLTERGRKKVATSATAVAGALLGAIFLFDSGNADAFFLALATYFAGAVRSALGALDTRPAGERKDDPVPVLRRTSSPSARACASARARSAPRRPPSRC